MKSIRIANNSVSAVVYGYSLAEIENEVTVIYLDLAPQHPKVIGAIWASLVNGAREWLRLTDENTDETRLVRGLNRRYHRLTMDAPRIAGRARPKFMRLLAPALVKFDAAEFGLKPFYAGAWSWRDSQGICQQMPPATALAAMLERGTHLPIRIGWGPYLLSEALARDSAAPLVSGGPAPEGYVFKPNAPWPEIIGAGVKHGRITLEGDCQSAMPVVPFAVPQPVQA